MVEMTSYDGRLARYGNSMMSCDYRNDRRGNSSRREH